MFKQKVYRQRNRKERTIACSQNCKNEEGRIEEIVALISAYASIQQRHGTAE